MDRNLLAVFAVVNSALYLAAIVGCGLFLGRPLASFCAIATLGIVFLSYAMQFMAPHWKEGNIALTALSWIAGVSAFLFLVIG